MSTIALPESLVARLRSAQRVAVLTGAGISAESGIPTFREAQTGLWAQYDPLELATPAAFRRDPVLVWEWYRWRRSLIENARPNRAHAALVRFEEEIPEFTLITQNVDGFHRLAGSLRVVELHGNIQRNRCSTEGCLVEGPVTTESGSGPPPCHRCGAPLRPDVVWFGEGLPPKALRAATSAAARAQVFLAIGTSAAVAPAASLPGLARQNGALLVEINPQKTALTPQADHVLNGPAGVVLPALVAATWKEG